MSVFNFKRQEIETKSFLVVDDFGDMRSMLKNMLTSLGVTRINSAASGAEAIDAITNYHYDIILCDYNLGQGKNGQQVLEEIRYRDLIGLHTIFVIISAENTRGMVMGAVEYEPDSYLTKPFTKDLLKSRLMKLIEKKKDLKDVEQAVGIRDYDKAIHLLDKKIAIKPKNLGELIKLKADLCHRAGDYEQALKIYEQTLAVREMPWAMLGLGKTLFCMRKYAEAKNVFHKLIKQNESLAASYDWLARSYLLLDDSIAAQQTLQKAVDISPKAIRRQRALGELALRNKDGAIAEKALSQAVLLGRNSVHRHPVNYTNLAKSKSLNGASKDGLGVLRQMRKEFKGDKQAALYAVIAETSIQNDIGNHAQAEESLSHAQELYQNLKPDVDVTLTLEMARACFSLGDLEQSSMLLQEAVRNNHADDEFLKEVGALFDEFGLESDSDALIAKICLEVAKLNNQGVKMAKEGRLDKAVAHFEKAVEAMAGNKVINLNAARIFIMNMQENGVDVEQMSKVRRYLDRVQASDPNNPTLGKLWVSFRKLAKESG